MDRGGHDSSGAGLSIWVVEQLMALRTHAAHFLSLVIGHTRDLVLLVPA
jgi:hypothetical protein